MSGLLAFSAPATPFADLSDGLRYFQRDSVLKVFEQLREHRSTLLVAATGLGKTQSFCAVAAEWPGRVLVLAHRDELVEQARLRLEAVTGEWVQIEKAERFAELTTRLVVASVDTMRSAKRLERFPRDHFSLIIVDEAHHYTGNTYTRPLDYFADAKVLGVTATPDRADGKALGQTFASVADVVDIERGIDIGYLVPLRGRLVRLESIDISHVGKSGGDLAAAALDEVILKAVEGVVRETLRLEPDRKAICFFPGIKSAEYAAEKFNLLAPNSARFLCGATPLDERRQIVRDFRKSPECRYLCNCMVATEGFDAPDCSLIVMARPTLSRSLYAQMTGRATRVLPGVVDSLDGEENAQARRMAIALSAKPDAMILDFVGNSGKHSLVGLEDVLGGRYTDEEKQRARKLREESSGGDPRAALERARAELRAIAASVQAKVRSKVQEFSPFKVLDVERPEVTGAHKPMSKGQHDFLRSVGVDDAELASLDAVSAQKLVATTQKRRQLGLATYKQLRVLAQYGVCEPNLTFTRAGAALNYISSTGWGRQRPIDPKILNKVAGRREPGEEG